MKSTCFVERFYVATAASSLSVTAAAKLYSSFGSPRILENMDPILKIPVRELMIGTGFVEIMILLALLLAKTPLTKYLSVLWLSSNFILYHWVHWYWKVPSPCACLGHVGDSLGLKPDVVNRALLFVVAYLFVGAVVCCVITWLRGQKEGNVASAPSRFHGTPLEMQSVDSPSTRS